MSEPLRRLTIKGYRSIRELKDFELRRMNVLIGANGAGKSNFVGFFHLLRELIEQRLQEYVRAEGGADACLHMGAAVTREISADLHFGICRPPVANSYDFTLVATNDNRLTFDREFAHVRENPLPPYVYHGYLLGSGHTEAKLKDQKGPDEQSIFHALSNWVVYHFDDTSATAGVRGMGQIDDDKYLQPDARNLAAFLYRIRHTANYKRIRDIVRLAAPFFDDFVMHRETDKPDSIWLEWRQRDSDYTFKPYHLSDGTLRFVCLATALLQPSPPSTMLFDEPELGLHPQAINLLGDLFQEYVAGQDKNSFSKQVIFATQSAALLNEFAPEDIVIVERTKGQSHFSRPNTAGLANWLEDYTLADLWQKNVFGGGILREDTPEEALRR